MLVAIFFLPRFLKSGIYTIPEYLEYRYSATARGIMAFYVMALYVTVAIAAVVYSGALTLNTIFDINMTTAAWIIGGIATLYTAYGGLKAVAWADLFQGSALILGGVAVMILGFNAVGGVGSFFETNADKLHVILPKDHSVIPWTALVFGLWIPQFYYWGLNQFIVQRTLGAKSLRHGQLGILFAAALKLLIPFIIVMPGIMAWQLYRDQLTAPGATIDAAYPLLIRNLVPAGFRGFIFAAISGAVISSLASMLNSASTILTMDLYSRHWKKDASPRSLVTIGRIATIMFVIIACVIAPHLGKLKGGIFTYIQEFHGFISPGILAAFVFGFVVKRAPASAAIHSLLLNIPLYGILKWKFAEIAFLNRIGISFIILFVVMAVITLIKPLAKPVVMPVKADYDMKPSPLVWGLGALLIAITAVLYIIFW